MTPTSLHPTGAENFEVASRFLENVFCTVLFAYRRDTGDQKSSVTVHQPIVFLKL
jgi:hypothetical protein